MDLWRGEQIGKHIKVPEGSLCALNGGRGDSGRSQIISISCDGVHGPAFGVGGVHDFAMGTVEQTGMAQVYYKHRCS